MDKGFYAYRNYLVGIKYGPSDLSQKQLRFKQVGWNAELSSQHFRFKGFGEREEEI